MGLARVGDSTKHGTPLCGSVGCPTVLVGGRPAWRAVSSTGAPSLRIKKEISLKVLEGFKAATRAASGTLAYPAAKAAEEAAKLQQLAQMSSSIISSAGVSGDIHMCPIPLPIPPHGPGVVINGSSSVLINGMPAASVGDKILEALGGMNEIVSGCTTVSCG